MWNEFGQYSFYLIIISIHKRLFQAGNYLLNPRPVCRSMFCPKDFFVPGRLFPFRIVKQLFIQFLART